MFGTLASQSLDQSSIRAGRGRLRLPSRSSMRSAAESRHAADVFRSKERAGNTASGTGSKLKSEQREQKERKTATERNNIVNEECEREIQEIEGRKRREERREEVVPKNRSSLIPACHLRQTSLLGSTLVLWSCVLDPKGEGTHRDISPQKHKLLSARAHTHTPHTHGDTRQWTETERDRGSQR